MFIFYIFRKRQRTKSCGKIYSKVRKSMLKNVELLWIRVFVSMETDRNFFSSLFQMPEVFFLVPGKVFEVPQQECLHRGKNPN